MRNLRDKISNIACGVALLSGCCVPVMAASSLDAMLGSKTPYLPQQSALSYERPPEGFVIEGLQLVARHGSRGLTKPGPDERLLKVLREAHEQQGLEPAGEKLLSAVERFIRAQREVGYGNLSALGEQEQQQLARRAVARLPGLFEVGAVPHVLLQSSGVDRAVDSARNFASAMGEAAPQLKLPSQPETDRFLLYFHKLRTGGEGADTPERQLTLRRSLAYQQWLRSPQLEAEQRRIDADPRLRDAAVAGLKPLFTAEYLDRHAEQLQDWGKDLMELRGAAAGLRLEMGFDFGRFLSAEQAAVFNEHDDAEDFYRKGPGLSEAGDVPFAIAGQLLDTLFAGLDGSEPRVRLRFAHAEIVAPLVSRIGISGIHRPQPQARPYAWAINPWRSSTVIPMAANVQWELWRGPQDERLVRMLLNEREADFVPACEAARWRPGSHFYRVQALRACYDGLK
ncbi:histidine-type phosphatase [Burkholderiaceae bacterium UC74_6]